MSVVLQVCGVCGTWRVYIFRSTLGVCSLIGFGVANAGSAGSARG